MTKKAKDRTSKKEEQIKEELHEDESLEDEEKSNHSNSSEESVHQVLSQVKNKNIFLTKVGFAFSIYYLAMLGMCIFIILDVRHTRTLYRAMHLDIVMWVFFSLSLVIKLTFGFIGNKLRSFIIIAYILDIILSTFFICGLYYFLDDKISNRFSNNAPFVVIYIINLFISAFIFTITTFYKSRSRIYNFFIGIGIMVLVNIGITLGIMFGWTSVVTITGPQYVGVMAIVSVIDVYIGINAYLIVNYRSEKFMENDALFCFYGFWIDWLAFFWIDLAKRTKFVRKRLNKNKKKAEREKEEKPVEVVPQDEPKKNKKKQSTTESELTSKVSNSKYSGSHSESSRASELKSKLKSKISESKAADNNLDVIV